MERGTKGTVKIEAAQASRSRTRPTFRRMGAVENFNDVLATISDCRAAELPNLFTILSPDELQDLLKAAQAHKALGAKRTRLN